MDGTDMNRVILIVASGLTLAGCASGGMGGSDWLPKFEPKPVDVQFQSQPVGAEAKTSTGQTCQTPCALPMPPDKDFQVTFSLAGYQPQTISVQPTKPDDGGWGEATLQPNPVEAVLVAVQKTPPKRTPPRRAANPTATPKPAAARPATPRPAAVAPPAAAPAAPAPATAPSGSDPWPNVR
jgi:hypothetical protein